MASAARAGIAVSPDGFRRLRRRKLRQLRRGLQTRARSRNRHDWPRRPPAATVDNTPSFTFTSDDPLFTRFECKLDEGPFFACASPYTSFALADGTHRFQVRALDTAGNVDQTPAESSFTVDTTAPVTSITAGPPATTADTHTASPSPPTTRSRPSPAASTPIRSSALLEPLHERRAGRRLAPLPGSRDGPGRQRRGRPRGVELHRRQPAFRWSPRPPPTPPPPTPSSPPSPPHS